jgi:hypothetical protein
MLITSQSPDHAATIRVKEFCTFPDCLVTVTLQTGWFTERKIVERSDCFVYFAHVAWSPDSRTAAIFVDNIACSSIHEGYDIKIASVVPFTTVADLMRQSVVREYGVRTDDLAPFGGDPLEWAHYRGDGNVPPGVHAFREKYNP